MEGRTLDMEGLTLDMVRGGQVDGEGEACVVVQEGGVAEEMEGGVDEGIECGVAEEMEGGRACLVVE